MKSINHPANVKISLCLLAVLALVAFVLHCCGVDAGGPGDNNRQAADTTAAKVTK